MSKETLLKQIYDSVNGRNPVLQNVPIFKEKLVQLSGLPKDHVLQFLIELKKEGLLKDPSGDCEYVILTVEGIKAVKHFN